MEDGDGEVERDSAAMNSAASNLRDWACTDLISKRLPPKNRQGYCAAEDDGHEHHLTEAAVMLAVAMFMFKRGSSRVELHPDGEHAKRFEITPWLEKHGFRRASSVGSTNYGGVYIRGDYQLIVDPKPGIGDVVGEIDGVRTLVECKGGVINSRHAGVSSKLRRGLCELIGLLMSKQQVERQIAAVPLSKETIRLAARMARRARAAGIEIALVTNAGELQFVQSVKEG